MLFLDKMSTTIACFGLVNSDLLSFSGLIKWPGYGYLLAFCCKNKHYAFFMDKTSFPWLAVDLLRTTKLFCWFPSPTLAEGSTIARWDRIFRVPNTQRSLHRRPGGVSRTQVWTTTSCGVFNSFPSRLCQYSLLYSSILVGGQQPPPLSFGELSKLDMFVC